MKTVIKRIACFLIGVCLVFSCGCNSTENSSSEPPTPDTQTAKRDYISLLYTFSDSFNPYAASTELNRQVCRLIYEPLMVTDNNLCAVFRLAESAVLEGKRCTVTIKNARFSDGSAVTSQDVIYSYQEAKKSSTYYAIQLYEVTSITAVDERTVVFELSQYDTYFTSLLDFPILKSGTASLVNSDGVSLPPTGCGRYVVNEEKNALIINDKYYGKKGNIKQINLIDAPDKDSISHYIEVGAADIYYTDISDGNIVRMSGKRSQVNLTNLVYIGINGSYGELAGQNMRYAISSALDRKTICSQAYYNNAVCATGYFHPCFDAVKHIQTIKNRADMQITVENLEKIGYNSQDSDGYRINSSGRRPSYTLLVNSENSSRVLAARLIASQLKDAGIEITVLERSFESYMQALLSGQFQLYLGETQILENMDFSSLVLPGGSCAFGVCAPPSPDQTGALPTYVMQAISGYKEGQTSVKDVASALMAEMPQIPVCYRKGLLFYSSDIKNDVDASSNDIYFSIETYNN